MILSLNWLRDFVELPRELDPRQLAERFTITTAEVEGVERLHADAAGLVAARIEAVEPVPGEAKLRRVTLWADRAYASLSTAPDLAPGTLVVFAPPKARVGGHVLGERDAAGRSSEGMIVAGQALGLTQVGANALFLPPGTRPGEPVDAALFDDWLIEIDNKSITHRPDCWGHYGIAREIAAMLGLKLRPYEATDAAKLRVDRPAVPIEIDDPAACPRYTALVMSGLLPQPAPLWMQVRLASCGMRPIDLIVDLTNYVMLELGQPMHAFDAARIANIQVGFAKPGEKFTTLDGVSRTLPERTLMIQSDRKHVAIAGIMGGAATEVGPKTQAVLLESANFDAATIRRAATAMGHRTEASARFEKSLDPSHTVLGIARFHYLAHRELPDLALAGTLSDCYPRPSRTVPFELDCAFASRVIGQEVSPERMTAILSALDFHCEPSAGRLRVTPPSFRATKDISIEADLIEEVARFVGYNQIEPRLPVVTARYLPPSPEVRLESATLDAFCAGEFFEMHDYIWYEEGWLTTIGFDPGPCLELKNPAGDNCRRLRRTLAPGLLAMADRNRRHLDRFSLVEIGSVFAPDAKSVESAQRRHLGLLVAEAGRKTDQVVWDRLSSAISEWGLRVVGKSPTLATTRAEHPWEGAERLAQIIAADRPIGRLSLVPLVFKQRIDERLAAWSIALAEIDMSAVPAIGGAIEKLPSIPRHPRVTLDFSALTPAARRYEEIAREVGRFNHPSLRRLSLVGAYQGGSIPEGSRSFTFRAVIGDDERTLSDEEIQRFRATFNSFLTSAGLQLRGGE